MSNNLLKIIAGLVLPLVGTALGSAAVFIPGMHKKDGANSIFSGFSAGIMTAASIWSLLLPAAEIAKEQSIPCRHPCIVGFFVGVLFISLTDKIASRFSDMRDKRNGNFLLATAITLHNIPEGMAAGAALAGIMSDNSAVSTASSMSLCIGITIQNIPDGAVVSIPLHTAGMKKFRAFTTGILTGTAELFGAILTLAFASLILPLLSYMLAFAAGTMIYTVCSELAPELKNAENKIAGTAAASAGFSLMMLLDIAFA